MSSRQWTTSKGRQESWSQDTQFWGPRQSMFLPRQPNQGRSEGAGLASRGLLAQRCQVTWVFAPHMRVLGGASATHTSRAHEGSTGSCRNGRPVAGRRFWGPGAHTPGCWVPLQNPRGGTTAENKQWTRRAYLCAWGNRVTRRDGHSGFLCGKLTQRTLSWDTFSAESEDPFSES